MGSDIRNIRKFNNELKSYEDRREYAESILEENVDMIDNYARTRMLDDDRLFEDKPINATLEEWGTYLLRGAEVDSARVGEYPFFETEKDYRKMRIGEKSISVDVNSEDKFDLFGGLDSNLDKEDEEPMVIDLDSMGSKEIGRLIRLGISEKDEESSKLRIFMQDFYDYIVEELKKEIDKDIFGLMITGKNDIEISEILGAPRRTINYRVNKITGIAGNYVY